MGGGTRKTAMDPARIVRGESLVEIDSGGEYNHII